MAAKSTKADTVTIDMQPLLIPIAMVVASLFLSIAIVISGVSIGNGLSGASIGTAQGNTNTGTADNPTPAPAPAGTPTTATVAIDDDPIKGDRNAKVYIVEFSDYECPFCQSFYRETLGQIESTYIDNGDVAFVFRDLPLSFHEPMASYAANLMECAQDRGGDEAYFAMHDFWFDNSVSNGTGVTDEQKIIDAANAAGLNGRQLLTCADNAEFADEIANDVADAGAIGISGTPGFVVGTLNDDGTVTGEIISGAYPFAEFDRVIQQYL